MSPISFSECLVREYAVATFQDVYILNDHGLFEGDDILGQNSTEDLYDEANTPRGQKNKPVVHMPVCRLWKLYKSVLLNIADWSSVSSLRRAGHRAIRLAGQALSPLQPPLLRCANRAGSPSIVSRKLIQLATR